MAAPMKAAKAPIAGATGAFLKAAPEDVAAGADVVGRVVEALEEDEEEPVEVPLVAPLEVAARGGE